MKIRTHDDFERQIDSDFTWRIKELSVIRQSIKHGRGDHIKIGLRTGVVFLYAHWDRFIKNAAKAYLNFVVLKRLNYDQLSDCFLELALKNKLEELKKTKYSQTVHVQFADFIQNGLSHRAKVPEDAIITQPNLNSARLKDLFIIIGLDYSRYELSFKLIDDVFLEKRNAIAHGNDPPIDQKDFDLLFDRMTQMIRDIKKDILKAAERQVYKQQRKCHGNDTI